MIKLYYFVQVIYILYKLAKPTQEDAPLYDFDFSAKPVLREPTL